MLAFGTRLVVDYVRATPHLCLSRLQHREDELQRPADDDTAADEAIVPQFIAPRQFNCDNHLRRDSHRCRRNRRSFSVSFHQIWSLFPLYSSNPVVVNTNGGSLCLVAVTMAD